MGVPASIGTMRPKLSLMVMRRVKAIRKLAAAIRNPMPGVLEGLEKYFGAALPGGEKTFDLLADGLLRELDWLVAIDHQKFEAENTAETLRLELRDATVALYQQMVKTRDSLIGSFGRAKARQLIKGRISRNPDTLRGQAEPIVKFLAWLSNDTCPEEEKPEGFASELYRHLLETHAVKLLTAQVDFERQESDLSIVREKWSDALVQIDDSCRATIKVAEGYHELAGVEAKLDSFRKAIRKRAYEKRQPEEDRVPIDDEAAEDDAGSD